MFKRNFDPNSDLLSTGNILKTSGVAECSAKKRSANLPQTSASQSWVGMLARQHSATSNWCYSPAHRIAIVMLSMIGSANSFCTATECAPAEGWDNFANNLGSDIAPLLALFGESVTTQYLNESFGTIDSLIFALAPLGIITAIAAAIRVAGEPTLRSLIGRAKESRGSVEADLMSSTSSDVCELWNGEGVVRVLGSPVLLQLVNVHMEPTPDAEPDAKRDMLYTFHDAIKMGIYKEEGREDTGGSQDIERFHTLHNPPNLSWNVSITPMKPYILVGFVVLGVLLQGSVLVFAAIAQYKFQLKKNDIPPVAYGFPIFLFGTLGLAIGMFLCAHEVEISTKETTWVPKSGLCQGSMIWLQQGGQTVGDQRFESFSRVIPWSQKVGAHNRIVTSSKLAQDTKKRRIFVVTAIGTALIGFVAQFAGLRVMNSTVIVAQLGAVLIMTAVRSCAHIQRSARNDITEPDRVEGHELDWLAKKLAKCKRWEVVTWPPAGDLVKASSPDDTAVKVMKTRASLAELSKDWKLEDRARAKVLQNAIEATINQVSSTMTLGDDLKGGCKFTWTVPIRTLSESGSPEVSSIDLVLTRETGESRIWSPWKADGREIEAVLCLWISTLIDDIRTTASSTNESQLEHFRLFGRDTQETKLDYKLWIDRGTTAETITPTSGSAMYFGRIADCDQDGFHYLGAKTEREIELLCAQELYTVFMSNLVHTVTDVGGITTKRVDNAADEINAREKFHLHNSNLASLATIYSNCGLGTTEEAYFSIIPAFRSVGRLPEPRKASRKLERDGLWDQATEIDLWLYKDPKKDGIKRRDAVVINDEIRNRLLRLTQGLTTGIAGGESNDKLRKMWNAAYQRCEKLEEASEERARSLVNLTTTCEKIKPETDLAAVFRLASKTVRKLDGRKQHTAEIVEILARFALEKELLGEAEILAKFLWTDMITRWEGSRMERNHFILKLLMDVRRTRGHVLINNELKQYLSRAGSLKLAAETDVHTGVGVGDIEGVPLDLLSIRKYQTPLQMAAGAGYPEIVKMLLDAEADVNAEPAKYSGRTALQAAAEAGDSGIVRTLLLGSADVNAKPAKYSGRTALQAAAAAGHAGIFKTLQWRGADVNAKPAKHSGRTALQAAAEAGHTKIVKILLKSIHPNTNIAPLQSYERTPSRLSPKTSREKITNPLALRRKRQSLQPAKAINQLAKILPQADVNAAPATYAGRTALQAASGAGHIDIVELLLKDNADVNALPAHTGGRTALQAAAEAGLSDIVELLLKHEADVNARAAEYSGLTALQAAAGGGHERIVTRLLSAKANVNAEPAAHLGRTALQAAAEAGHINIVELLLKKGAEVDAEPAEYSGRTALQAAAGNGHGWVVTRLLSAKAAVNAEPAVHSGRTALQAAAEAGNINIVELLLKEGADVNNEPAEYSGLTALQAAAGGGHESIVSRLILAKANVNAEPAAHLGRTALQAASGAGHAEIIHLLLTANAEIDAAPASNSGRTALQASAEAGLTDIVDLLLEEKAKVDTTPAPYSGRTALQAAAGAGHIDMVKRLLAASAEVNAEPASDSGRTALQAAAEAGFTEIVELLIEKGANVNSAPGLSSGRMALQAAAGAGHTGIVTVLLDAEADVDAEPASYSGRTALQAAAEAGFTEIVELLIEKGANVNSAPGLSSGRMALQAAAGAGHTGIVTILLDAGADVNTNPTDYSGRSALQAAAEAGRTDVVEILLQRGAGVDLEPTPLQLASRSGHLEIVKLLMKANADINTSPAPNSGRTALQAAAGAGHTEIVKFLLENKADVNAKPANSSGRTALQAAAGGGHVEIVNILLDNKASVKADVNAVAAYYFGRTALQAAAEAGHLEIVRVLLDASADVNAGPARYSGRTALQAAVEAGHTGVVEILLEKGANLLRPIAGMSLTLIAERRGYNEIVDLLQSAGPTDLISRNNSTNTWRGVRAVVG